MLAMQQEHEDSVHTSQKRAYEEDVEEHEEEEMVSGEEAHSQDDLFEEGEEEATQTQMQGDAEDLFTQARTQVENRFFQKQPKRANRTAEMFMDPDLTEFNPKPDAKEVAQVRQNITSRLSFIHQNKAALMASSGTEKLTSMIASENADLSRVHRTSEATLDSRFMTTVADIGMEKVQKLPFGLTDFSLDDFVALFRASMVKLQPSQKVGDIADPWDVLGRKASIFWKGCSSCDFLCGPIAVAPKEKTQKKRNLAKAEKAPVKEVEGMSKEDFETQAAMTSTTATSNNVILVHQAMSRYDDAIPFHAFISHPTSFARSVENLFYCSFLVAEGRASIKIDPEGEIMIEAVEEVAEGANNSDNVRPKHQSVFNFSIAQWHAALRRYEIEQPLIDFE